MRYKTSTEHVAAIITDMELDDDGQLVVVYGRVSDCVVMYDVIQEVVYNCRDEVAWPFAGWLFGGYRR